jgi:trk system potassium uptake protein TrkH
MNHRILGRVLGHLLMLLAAAMVVCDLAGFAYELHREEVRDFGLLWAALLTGLTGFLLWLAGRGGERVILRKEAIAIVGLGWILATIFGALPYVLCQPALSFSGALFESASGFTTTGASVMQDIEAFPPHVLLWRGATQWLGGGGILVLFVALLSGLGVGDRTLLQHESSLQIREGFYARIRELAAQLWWIYLALSLVCALGLAACGANWFEALVYTFATISTGGFAPYNASAAHFTNPLAHYWLILFMGLGGTSFLWLAGLARGRWRQLAGEEEFRLYLAILGGAALILFLILGFDTAGGWTESHFRQALFQAVSITTTTGFATVDYEGWPPGAQVVIFLLMFVGGCVGSTGGSIKVRRYLLLGRALHRQVLLSFRPQLVRSVRINGRNVPELEVTRAAAFVVLFFVVLGAGILGLALLEPELGGVTVVSAVVTALTNVGPGFGEVGPASNFAGMGAASRIWLAGLMILGRLEMFAILALLAPSLWRRY